MALSALFIIKNTFLAGFSYVQARYILNRQITLANRLFRTYLLSAYAFHLRRNTAELVSNTNNEAMRVVSDVLLAVVRIVMEVLVIIALLVLLVSVEPIISLCMITLLAATSIAFLRIVRRKVAQFGLDEYRHRSAMIRAVNEGLGSLKDIKLLGREHFFLNSFSASASAYTQAAGFKTAIFELPRLFLETIAVLAMLAVAAVFIYEHRSIGAIVPTLTLLALVSVRLIPSANRIVNGVMSVRWALPALDAVHADLVALETPASPRAARTTPSRVLQVEIEFANVHFRYPGSPVESLKGVSFTIKRGTAVAIIGASGAGKTTAADVLLGLLEPSEGEVRVDGVNIRQRLTDWQRQIGYIPQHIFLSDDTIRRNVAIGIADEEVNDAAVWNALAAAQLKEFVEALPQQLDASVGERGVRLSGGQRQRIGIARALYHDPAVLMMDEATSALDHRTEGLIIETLERLRGNRTIIAIAHRHSTVRRFDNVLVLRDGRLEAQGRFDEVVLSTA